MAGLIRPAGDRDGAVATGPGPVAASSPAEAGAQAWGQEARTVAPGPAGSSPREGAPSVSVLVTTHATDPGLLRSSLSSALNQSLRDLELIVVVDGKVGPDLAALLDEFESDPRVDVLRPGRVGRGAALNLGLAATRAEFIAIQDSDDESHPLRFERQLRCFAEHPDLDLLATGAVNSFDTAAHAEWDVPPGPDRVVVVDRQLITRNVLVHTSVMARRSLFERLVGYDASRQRYFDYDLYLRARTIDANMARLVTPLVLLRAHRNQSFAAERGAWRKLKDLYRLQISHVRHEPALMRSVYRLRICIRMCVRHVRGELRRRRKLSGERLTA